MTSPMPFMGLEYDELEAALMKVSSRYPESEIYLVGTSFGGNYLMRYLMRKKVSAKIKGLVALAPPINVSEVVDQMGSVYQKFFVKRYIEETVTKHPQMLHWERIGLVDMKKVKNSQNLREFHNNISAKILGLPSCEDMFRQYTISPT